MTVHICDIGPQWQCIYVTVVPPMYLWLSVILQVVPRFPMWPVSGQSCPRECVACCCPQVTIIWSKWSILASTPSEWPTTRTLYNCVCWGQRSSCGTVSCDLWFCININCAGICHWCWANVSRTPVTKVFKMLGFQLSYLLSVFIYCNKYLDNIT